MANSFAIGNHPLNVRDVTITERRLTSLASFRGHTVLAREEGHILIKSHIPVLSSQPEKIREGIDKALDDENRILLIFTNPMTSPQRTISMKRHEARREKVNAFLVFYIENNTQCKCLKPSECIRNMLQISDEELNDINLVHKIEELEAAAGISIGESNMRQPIVFEEASKPDEELLILQRLSIVTSEQKTIHSIFMNLHSGQSVTVTVRTRTSFPSGALAKHLTYDKCWRNAEKLKMKITEVNETAEQPCQETSKEAKELYLEGEQQVTLMHIFFRS